MTQTSSPMASNHKDNSAPEAIYIHFVDRPGPNQWVWSCTMDLADFLKMAEISSKQPEHAKSIRVAMNSIVSAVVANVPPAPEDGIDWENQLGGFVAMHAGSSKFLHRIREMSAGSNFIVFNYRKTLQAEPQLRLVIQPRAPADENEWLENTIKSVVAKDRQEHPGWFN